MLILQVSCNKPCWLSKLDVLGAHLSEAGLKSWMPDVGFKPFPPLGGGRRNSGFWVPSWLWVITMWVVGFMVTLCLSPSYLLPCWFFFSFIQCGGVSQLVWGFFYPEEVIPSTAVDSVYLWEEVSSRPSYNTILNLFIHHELLTNTGSNYEMLNMQGHLMWLFWVRNGFLIWSCKCTTLKKIPRELPGYQANLCHLKKYVQSKSWV